MNSTTLASYANLALYSSMAVFALAMLAYTGHLASLRPMTRADAAALARTPVLVGADGAAEHDGGEPPADAASEAAAAASAADFEPSARSRRLAAVGLRLTWLATMLLAASVLMRGLSVMRPPWGNMFEFATAAACVAAIAFSVLARQNRWDWLGLFVVGPVLLTLGLAVRALYVEATELMPILDSVWLVIHVSVAILAVGAFTISAALAVVYLLKSRRVGRADTSRSFLDSLPSTDAIERGVYAVTMVGFILWTFTLVAGAIWAQKAWGSYWTWDPKEVWTFVVWCVYAAYMHARATAGWEHKKATIISLVGYAAIIVNFAVVNIYFVGKHSYSGK